MTGLRKKPPKVLPIHSYADVWLRLEKIDEQWPWQSSPYLSSGGANETYRKRADALFALLQDTRTWVFDDEKLKEVYAPIPIGENNHSADEPLTWSIVTPLRRPEAVNALGDPYVDREHLPAGAGANGTGIWMSGNLDLALDVAESLNLARRHRLRGGVWFDGSPSLT